MTPPRHLPLTPGETLCAILCVWVALLVTALAMCSDL